MEIRQTKEFKKRSKCLGKLKNHRKEYNLLERILKDPFPMNLSEEPITQMPGSYGWAYFNLEFFHPNEPIHPEHLFKSIALLNKVVTRAWEIVLDGRRYFSDGYDEYVGGKRVAMPEVSAVDTGYHLLLSNPEKLSFKDARTVLHVARFGKPDYDGNLWQNPELF